MLGAYAWGTLRTLGKVQAAQPVDGIAIWATKASIGRNMLRATVVATWLPSVVVTKLRCAIE